MSRDTLNHTPGPWRVEDPFGPDALAIVDSGKTTAEWKIIAACFSDEDGEDLLPRIERNEMQANAHLLAAAPDLYSALAAMVERWEPDCGGTDRVMYDNAVLALAYARGETLTDEATK